jgi:hypothetical protein
MGGKNSTLSDIIKISKKETKEIFVNSTCINGTPVYSEHKS